MSAESIGGKFRAARERLALDYQEVAARTKINSKFLEAIEAGDFKKLPGPFFGKCFVRQYATMLGLDWGEIEPEIALVWEPQAPPPASSGAPADSPEAAPPAREAPIPIRKVRKVRPTVAPMPAAQARLAEGPAAAIKRVVLSFVLFILVMLGCSMVYSLWQRFHQSPDAGKPVILHREPTSALNQPALPGENPPPQSDLSRVSTGAVSAKPALDLTATEDTWVSVSSDGRTAFMGVLKANETKSIADLQSARLLIGNAGGLQVRWNGKALGPFGPRGQVRIVKLSPDSVEVSLPHEEKKQGSEL